MTPLYPKLKKIMEDLKNDSTLFKVSFLFLILTFLKEITI